MFYALLLIYIFWISTVFHINGQKEYTAYQMDFWIFKRWGCLGIERNFNLRYREKKYTVYFQFAFLTFRAKVWTIRYKKHFGKLT